MEKADIRKGISSPLSQQIVRQIVGQISSGQLKPGDKLIPERKLAEQLGVSRGTVNTAYTFLKNSGIVNANRGGYYKVIGTNESAPYQLSSAEVIIDDMLSQLRTMGLNDGEIRQLISLRMRQHRDDTPLVHVAVVECRKDIYYLFEQQLTHIPNVELTMFLLDEVLHSPFLAEQIMDCDIVFTTATHHYDLLQVYPDMRKKTVEIVTAWSQKTVFDLAAIQKTDHVGVIYNSPLTVQYIQTALKYFGIVPASFSVCHECNIQYLENFIVQQDIVIAEPPCIIFHDDYLANAAKSSGTSVISFEYSIDKGSLMTIEQAINDIREKKTTAPVCHATSE